MNSGKNILAPSITPRRIQPLKDEAEAASPRRLSGSSRPSLSIEQEREASGLNLFVGLEEDFKEHRRCPDQPDKDQDQSDRKNFLESHIPLLPPLLASIVVYLFLKECALDLSQADAERFPGDLV
jgi:hypothetical protein